MTVHEIVVYPQHSHRAIIVKIALAENPLALVAMPLKINVWE